MARGDFLFPPKGGLLLALFTLCILEKAFSHLGTFMPPSSLPAEKLLWLFTWR
jgi:hypothetical protein